MSENVSLDVRKSILAGLEKRGTSVEDWYEHFWFMRSVKGKRPICFKKYKALVKKALCADANLSFYVLATYLLESDSRLPGYVGNDVKPRAKDF